MQTAPFDLVIGLDRADRKIDLHLIEVPSGQSRQQQIETSPEALQQWVHELRERYPTARVALCLEQPAPALLIFLEAHAGFLELYALNPITLKRFREAFKTSRANCDATDAEYLAKLLVSHHRELPRWRAQDPQTRQLQILVEHRRAVIEERTALTNRLQALLKSYFPQALELCGEDLWRPLASDFLLRWPSLAAVRKAKAPTLRQFYYLHGSRSATLLDKRLGLLSAAVPLSEQNELVESYALRVKLVARQLAVLGRVVREYEQRIAQAYAAHPDHAIFASFPGAGPVLGTRLLSALGSRRERFPSASALQSFSAIAPVTKRSGGKCHIQRRYSCAKFLRQSFHEYARESVRHSAWAAAYYQQQRQKGSGHHAAVRSLAYKWQRILWRCWQDGKPYNETTYQSALKNAGSPLAAKLPDANNNSAKNPEKSLA
jgi:transposase